MFRVVGRVVPRSFGTTRNHKRHHSFRRRRHRHFSSAIRRMNELKAAAASAMTAGDLPAAKSKYEEALSKAESDVDVGAIHSNLSLVHLKLEDYDGALRHAERCIEVRPNWAKGEFRKGEALFGARRYEDAAKSYESSLDLDDDGTKSAVTKHRLQLAKEASSESGWYFRQLLPGRDICLRATDPTEQQIFGVAAQMQNFIYLVGDARERKCVAVDGCWDVGGILARAARDKMELVGAVATHYHFDHVGGMPPPPFDQFGITVPGFKELVTDQNLPGHCHKEDTAKILEGTAVRDGSLVTAHGDGDEIAVGRKTLKVMATPGHSPGSCVLVVSGDVESGTGTGDGLALTGDTVFPGSCGRLDLPDSSKERMWDSLRKCAGLPDGMKIYPGHNYNGAFSTVRREKTQGLLRPVSKEEFLAQF